MRLVYCIVVFLSGGTKCFSCEVIVNLERHKQKECRLVEMKSFPCMEIQHGPENTTSCQDDDDDDDDVTDHSPGAYKSLQVAQSCQDFWFRRGKGRV